MIGLHHVVLSYSHEGVVVCMMTEDNKWRNVVGKGGGDNKVEEKVV